MADYPLSPGDYTCLIFIQVEIKGAVATLTTTFSRLTNSPSATNTVSQLICKTYCKLITV